MNHLPQGFSAPSWSITGLEEINYDSASAPCTRWIEIAPSPTADATRFTFPERMSPTAKTAGKLVSSICGDRLVSLEGESDLERVTWLDQSSGERMTRDIRHVFVMAGASPRSDWLRGCVVLDQQGFILTGRDLDPVLASAPQKWPLGRSPQMLETSLPAVFAVGDIRSGNVKRVASAVGEGAISIHLVHGALAEI